MKKLILITAMFLIGCGYSSKDNEVVGQVKRVMVNTPIICPDFYDVDLSMGMMKNGTGSVSKEDLWLYIPDKAVYETLKQAASSGIPVKITYDVKRTTYCVEDHVVTKVEPAN